jgi:hypothetical protein
LLDWLLRRRKFVFDLVGMLVATLGFPFQRPEDDVIDSLVDLYLFRRRPESSGWQFPG